MTIALNISNLTVRFPGQAGGMDSEIEVVSGCSLQVNEGEIVGLVGESGSGKSLSAMCAMGLQPEAARVTADQILVAGYDVQEMNEAMLEKIRGRGVGLVPQEPMNSLNPTMRIGSQLEIVIRTHQPCSRSKARNIGAEFLESMLIPDIGRVMRAFPYELSGGMRQRVLLAMAFACRPKLLIADEPTTALDVTVQKEVLDLMAKSASESNTAVLLITHDLGVVWNTCQRIYVMQTGRIVESGETKHVIGHPEHPYVKRLLAALPENSPRQSLLQVDRENTEPNVQESAR